MAVENTTIARPYAEAVFARAKASKSLDKWSEMLGFLATVVKRTVLIIGVIIAVSVLGINIGPVIAVIGAAGFVIAFALVSDRVALENRLLLDAGCLR